MEQTGEDQFCRVLLSPKQMSFGDWVNALPGELKRSDYVKNHAAVSKYLKKMTVFYNNSGIVKWRNDFLGHGLMSNPEDISFFVDVKNRINALIDFLNRQSVPVEIRELDFEHMEPFMFQEGGEVYLLESVERTGTAFYLNQSTRRRQVSGRLSFVRIL